MLNRIFTLYKDSLSGLSRPVWILTLISLVNRSGTMVIPFLSIYLTEQLGLTLIQTGYVMVFFGLGSIGGSFLGGKLADWIGAYQTIFWSLVLTGFGFYSLQYMDTFWSVSLTIFLVMIIADAYRPAVISALEVYSKPENRTRSYSLLRLAINLGFAVGPAAGGLLAHRYGYEWLFWIDGTTCILAGFTLRFLLKEKRRKRSSEEKEEQKVAKAQVLSAYRDPHYLFFILVTCLGGIVFMQLFSTVPVFFRQELHYSEATIGALMAMNGGLIFLIEMPMVFILEKKYPSLLIIAGGVFLIGACYLLLNLGFMAAVILGIVAITIGEIMNFPFANSYAMSYAPPARLGEYSGLYTMAFSLAHLLAPLLGMLIAENLGFSILWYFAFGLGVLLLPGYQFLKKKESGRALRLAQD